MTQAVGSALADTFPKLLAAHAGERGAAVAFRYKRRGIWQAVTWAEAYCLTGELAAGFAELGIKSGDRVVLAGNNNPRLYCSIAAIQTLGAMPVLLHADMPAERLAKLMVDAGARLAIVEGQEQADKVLANQTALPLLRNVLYHLDRGMRGYDRALFRPLEEVRVAGQAWLAGAGRAGWFTSRITAGQPSDIACILYTAGTTGAERGVCLLSGRCVEAARAGAVRDGLQQDDVVFAHLPPSTVDDFYFTYAQTMVAGACIACPESPETAPSDLCEIGPTFHCLYPQQLKDLATQVNIRMNGAGRVRRWVFRHFIDAAQKRYTALPAGRASFASRLHHAIGDLLIYGPLKNALGLSRIRTMYVAGEAVSTKLLGFYRAIGLNLKQFYGQTEAFYQIAVQPADSCQSLKPAPGVALRLNAAGEIEFRSPGMLAGYLDADGRCCGKRITDDGFVRSGDLGVLDRDGGLMVIGRAGDIGRLASGRSFSPDLIERRLRESPFISEAAVFGDGCAYVVGLVAIDFAVAGRWAARRGIVYVSQADLVDNPTVVARVRREITQANGELPAHPSGLATEVLRFAVLPWPFDADADELTATNKLKRQVVAQRYQAVIDALAGGDGCASLDVARSGEGRRCEGAAPRIRLHDVDDDLRLPERLLQ